MASTFDDTVLDFDLNFLQQPPTVVNDCKYDKQRKSIHVAKKKIIATHSLIRKYYAKNEQFEQTEVLRLAAKEECRQVCMDYKETLEKCTQFEKDAVILKTRNKELEDSNILLQNQCEAIKSHANQLQVLVNEHESTIEVLKAEKQLNKNNTKDSVTKLTELQNDNETLLKHLCLIRDIVFGKKKLKKHHKLLLKKYDKFKYDSDGEESSEESSEENLFFDSLPPSPMSVNDMENKKEVAFNVNRNSNLVKKVIEDHESDCSNEVVSEDTGRGSSLAFSDGEKCFNSPDYFQNDSLFATDATKVKNKKTFADIGTNPIHKEFKHVGTSPIVFEEETILKNDVGVQVESNANELEIISNITTKENNKLINRATSPIPDIDTSASCSVLSKDAEKVLIDKGIQVNSDSKKVHIISDVIVKEKDTLNDRGTSPIPDIGISASCSVLSKDAEKVLIDKGIQVNSDSKKVHIISDLIVKEKDTLIDRGTSPIADVDVSTSSPISKDGGITHDSINTLQPVTEIFQSAKSRLLCEESMHSNSCDVNMTAVSQDNVSNNDIEQDSANNCVTETLRENCVNISQPTQINIQDLTSQCEIEFSGNSSSTKEKMCLERNNSKCISNEGINDSEIEMILNTMRLTERLITPIPKTPVKLSRKKSKQLMSPVPEKFEPLNVHTGCVEALKLKEENKYLKSSISGLSKEIMKIKRILKNQMLMPESPKKLKHDDDKTIMSDLTEDSSQETLVINVNNDVKRTVDLNEDLPLSEYIWKEKETKILQNVKTNVRVSPREHDRSYDMLVADTNESRKKIDSHTPKNNSRANNNEEYIIDNDKEVMSQDHSKEFSDAEMADEGLRKKKVNAIKLSRLEKFRKKLLPKGKIARIKAPIRKLQTKPKSIQKLVNKNNLNNKTAYEKAVNIMKELKLKEVRKENDISKSKKQSETESKKKEYNEAVALNKGLDKSSECSPNKEVPFEFAEHKPNVSVKIAQHSPSKEDSLQITQPLINKNNLVEIQCSSDKEDLVKNGQCSPNKKTLSKEISDKNAHCSLSKGELDKFTQPLPNSSDLISKELSVKTEQPSANKNDLTNIIQYSPNKDISKNGKYLPNNNDSFKISPCAPSKEVSVEIPQSLPNTNDLVKIAQCSPSKEDSVKTVQCSPTKEDALNNIKQPIVCLYRTKLDAAMNKNSRHEYNSETNQNIFKTAHSPQHDSFKNYVTTRSRSKMSDQESITSSRISSIEFMRKCTEIFGANEGSPSRKRKQSDPVTSSEISCKRVLRSSNVREIVNDHSAQNESSEFIHTTHQKRKSTESENSPKSYSQIDISKIFAKSNEPLSQFDISKELNDACIDDMITTKEPENHPKQSILCKMIDKYGKVTIRSTAKKVPDSISNAICKKLEDNIAHIIQLPPEEAKPAMSKLVEDIHNFKLKNFLCGFLKYLKDPARKVELFSKVASPPAPPMSKSEQVILYIVKQLCASVPDIVNIILTQIEFSLFQLNKTPEFEVIESLSHVYALICRYFGLKMRLRLFILDAMYCLSFKVVPLIKQCLDVWMHILPLAHMGIAKTPLVTCLVYLLHFYKCEDRFKRVEEIRGILNRKFFYQITEWNEPKMLELFRTSILEIRDNSIEKKMLRMALIILAKRQGPAWCQKNIIKKMLMPLIEKEDIPLRVKQFGIEMLGPILKPYPADMKLHCEIVVNNLLDMLDQNPQDSLKEAIFTSLIYMSKHNQNRVLQLLLSWRPKQVTPEFELLLKDYVQEKPLKVWKMLLSRINPL